MEAEFRSCRSSGVQEAGGVENGDPTLIRSQKFGKDRQIVFRLLNSCNS